MSCCDRKCMFAAGVGLAVVAAGVGWTLYILEKQKTTELAAKVASLEPEAVEYREVKEGWHKTRHKDEKRTLAEMFRQMANEEDAKVGRARNEMLTIKKAYETYYTQNLSWPPDPTAVYPLLEQGKKAFETPWPGVTYQVGLGELSQPDGSIIERPVVTCQPPGKPMFSVPQVNAGK